MKRVNSALLYNLFIKFCKSVGASWAEVKTALHAHVYVYIYWMQSRVVFFCFVKLSFFESVSDGILGSVSNSNPRNPHETRD